MELKMFVSQYDKCLNNYGKFYFFVKIKLVQYYYYDEDFFVK